MLKSALTRQGRLCFLPVAARSVQFASKIPSRSFARSTQSTASIVASTQSLRLFTRTYSATASATAPVEDVAPEREGPVTRFQDLASIGVDENVVRTITEGMGYETMTAVQSLTIQPALTGKDLVAQAKTGTGKTLAFLVPVIQRIIQEDPRLVKPGFNRALSRDIRAIIVSPTRELAEQIGTEARKLTQNTGVVVQTAVGGTGKREMLRRTQRQGCHLMVATPGRLLDLLSDESTGIDAPRLSALVLDEADRMLDVGFADELKNILRYLPDRSERPRQTLLFSATIPSNVVGLAKSYVDPKNFEFVQTIKADETPTHAKVPQHIVPCRGFENFYPALLELIYRDVENSDVPFKAIVFLPTKSFVELTASTFARLATRNPKMPEVLGIHSGMTQRERTNSAEYFKRAKSAILFSSDVTARGMHFPNVTHVIQLACPPDREQYIHRIGRTGRADKSGQGWIFVAENEIHDARRILTNLPIQRNTELKTASIDLSAEDPETTEHETVKAVANVMKRAKEELLSDTYRSLLGGSMKSIRRPVLVESLNNLALHGWRLQEPPAISESMARKSGLLGLPGLNIAERKFERRREPRPDQASQSFDEFEDPFATELGNRPRGGFGDRSRGGFRDRSRGGFQDRPRRDFRDRSSGRFQDRSSRNRNRDGSGEDRAYRQRPQASF